jgi:hypothetical protein
LINSGTVAVIRDWRRPLGGEVAGRTRKERVFWGFVKTVRLVGSRRVEGGERVMGETGAYCLVAAIEAWREARKGWRDVNGSGMKERWRDRWGEAMGM